MSQGSFRESLQFGTFVKHCNANMLVKNEVSVVCGPGGHVSLLFRSFSNPSSLLLSGYCCDPACADCNYYFVFCIRDKPSSASCLVSGKTKTYHNYKHLVFSSGDSLGNGWKNPLEGSFSSWKGVLSFSIDIYDYDYFSEADVVDRLNVNKLNVTPTPWMESVKWKTISLGGSGHPSTMTVKYNIQCNANYYGPNCTKYCIAHDDDVAGHYTCDKATGHKVCRAGWHGASCKVYCVPHDDDTHGHYSCEPATGRKICLQGWYGSSCKVHCVPRNDSLAGYTCDSQGQKVCLRNWYGKDKCDVYCKQTNDSNAAYSCDSIGNKVCLQRWYGPFCDCTPRNDSSMGYKCNITTGKRECFNGWFGGDCNVHCLPRNDSAGHYTCHSGTGAKECLPNWFGGNCTVYCRARNDSLGGQECTINGSRLCASNWYGPSCSVYCSPRNDKGGQYTCNLKTGQKICEQDWYGDNCTKYCVPKDSDFFGHYNCNKIDGRKQCHSDWYGSHCTFFCTPHNDTHGHYTCDGTNGTKVCLEDWFGTECKTYCKAMNNSQGHYYCRLEDGAKICHKHWYGTNCLVHCMATNDSRGHYECDPSDGSKICHADFYGPNCSTRCIPKRGNADGHYDCNIKDGSKACLPNWYGQNCSVYCTARNDSTGHYECNAVDGSWSCLDDWYGPHCSVQCSPQNTSAGHYTCDLRNGSRICLPGWTGQFCDKASEESTLPWTHPTLPSQYKNEERIVIKFWHQWNGEKFLNEALDNLKSLFASKLNKFCESEANSKCGLPDSWFPPNRSLFDSESILVEATQLTNETLTVEVAVKLPPSVKGSVPGRTLEEAVMINKAVIKNVTSAEIKEVYVVSPSLPPGLSGSAVSTRSSTVLSSSLFYVIVAAGFTILLLVVIIASWSFFKYRRRSRVRVIKVTPACRKWSSGDNIALVSRVSNEDTEGIKISRGISHSTVLPCGVVLQP
ncbi:hypothetical protein ACROYT_G012787 [Oculina patagonica]